MPTEETNKRPDEIVAEIISLLHKVENATDSEANDIYKKAVLLAKDNGWPVFELLANEMYPTIEKELNAEIGNCSLNISILLGKIGESAIPSIVSVLPKSEWAHYALGHLGSDKAIDMLIKELHSTNWRRVAAAASGIAISKNKRALPELRAIYAELPNKMPVGEVSNACQIAIKELEGASGGKQIAKFGGYLYFIGGFFLLFTAPFKNTNISMFLSMTTVIGYVIWSVMLFVSDRTVIAVSGLMAGCILTAFFCSIGPALEAKSLVIYILFFYFSSLLGLFMSWLMTYKKDIHRNNR